MATTTRDRYSPEDLLAINDRPMPELIDGQLVERETGQKADAVNANVCSVLGRYSIQTKEGLANGPQCGYQIFADDPEKVRVPSASFTLRERLPRGQEAEGHATVRPDLVVEVVFPHSHPEFIREKIRDFLDAGVPWAWVVNPDDQTVVTFQADGKEERFGVGDTIDGDEILPGFRCPVGELFELGI